MQSNSVKANSVDSDQTAHLGSLILVFTVWSGSSIAKVMSTKNEINICHFLGSLILVFTVWSGSSIAKVMSTKNEINICHL